MAPNISVAVGVLGIIYLLLLAFHRFTQSAKEPQSICNGVPFITPLLSMVALGSSFHRLMRDKYNLLIHTLRIPGTRFYIVNSPSLITSVQNRFRILSFPAIEAGIAAKVFGVTEVTNKVFRHNLTSDEGYLMSFPKYVHSALGAGPGRDAMNRRAVQVVASSLNTLAGTENGFRTVHMFQWIRHELLIATTEGVYGPKNPFRDPTMERAWYTFEPGMMMFVLNLFPRLLARKSFQAREYMAQVWQQYFDNEWYKQGSDLVKARVKINEDFEIPMSDTARLEVAGTQAILTNTIPCTFWVVLHIFSDPVVLEEIRQELYQGVRTNDSGTHTIDLGYVQSSCPILLSTFKETMRFHSLSVATRLVMEDHLLDLGKRGHDGRYPFPGPRRVWIWRPKISKVPLLTWVIDVLHESTSMLACSLV